MYINILSLVSEHSAYSSGLAQSLPVEPMILRSSLLKYFLVLHLVYQTAASLTINFHVAL